VTKKLNEVEENSPRKDDAKDAAQICKLVGAGLFVGRTRLAEAVAEMRVLATERHRVGVEQTRLRNRLHSVLDVAWPEFAAQFAALTTPTPVAILRRWPLPADLAGASPRAVRALVVGVSRNHFGPERLARLLTSARETVGLPSAPDARRSEIRRLLERLALVQTHIAAVEARLAALVAAHPGARALSTVPEVSAVCAATLVAELGAPETYASPKQVLKLAGMNLARRESGTSVRGRVKQTKRGRPLLRRQLFLLAGRWCAGRGLYRAEYLALTARNGGSRTSAMCAVARRHRADAAARDPDGRAVRRGTLARGPGARHDRRRQRAGRVHRAPLPNDSLTHCALRRSRAARRGWARPLATSRHRDR
jgi:transposase